VSFDVTAMFRSEYLLIAPSITIWPLYEIVEAGHLPSFSFSRLRIYLKTGLGRSSAMTGCCSLIRAGYGVSNNHVGLDIYRLKTFDICQLWRWGDPGYERPFFSFLS
jgi:hypothetical protein